MNNELLRSHKIILAICALIWGGIILAFIFPNVVIDKYQEMYKFSFVFEICMILAVLYGLSLLMVLGKYLSLYTITNEKLNLGLFLFFSYGKTIYLTILTMGITIGFINEVNSSYPLLLLIGATCLTILVFFMEKQIAKKIKSKYSKGKRNLFFSPIEKGIKKEKELREIYNIEKIYGIVAAITTILILGDATGALLEPLKGDNAAQRWDSYRDTSSYQLLVVFVSSTIVYIFEMLIKGIKNKNNDEQNIQGAELETIVTTIKSLLTDELSESDKVIITDSVDFIQEELKKENRKKGLLKTAWNDIDTIIKKSPDAVQLVENLNKLGTIVGPYLT
ncbi:hypothetical protein ACIQYL_20140 [Lysinibacillus xylanilyticus]|uniref:hypothetical protein n=1 Tax=Lysinibacillus xylanilyticus TaxID=582475 RepID=UPI003827F17A